MKTAIIAIVLVVVIASASAFGAYSYMTASSPSLSSTPNPSSTPAATQTSTPTESTTPTPTTAATMPPQSSSSSSSSSSLPHYTPTSSFNPISTIIVEQTQSYVIIKDSYDHDVNISLPVNTVVCITSGVTEIIFAIDAGDKVIGRDSYATYPTAALDVPIVAQSSASPNMELIVDLSPDLIIADTMLSASNRESLEELLGIPVLIQSASQSDNVVPLTEALGVVFGAQTDADELIDFMTGITDIINERLMNLSENQKPLVYYEWNKLWFSTGSKGLPTQMIIDAGGINLAENETVSYPTLSAEYVFERNPDIVVRSLSDKNHDITEYVALREEVVTREGLAGTKAVQNDEVYILSSSLRTGIRNPIGLLYMAKWFHPDLFTDVDPAALHSQMIQNFFGETLTGTFAYP